MTGSGFIGGGAILQLNNSVRGMATAASLWGTGAIGAVGGLCAYKVAIVISGVTCATLFLLPMLKPKDETLSEDSGQEG